MHGFSPAFAAYLVFLAFALGASLGSFLHCAAWRATRGQSVLRGRSHCPQCGHTLGFIDLIPVLGWAIRGGKCRYCGTAIPARYPASEALLGFIFVFLILRFGLTPQTAEYMLLACILLALSIIDLDSMELPGVPMLAAALSWCAFLCTYPQPIERIKSGLVGGLVLGGGVLAIVLVMDKILGRETMGGGDIKLFALMGLYFGLGRGLLLVIISCFVGLAFALAAQKGNREFPFGPCIAAAALPTALFGTEIIQAYLNLFI